MNFSKLSLLTLLTWTLLFIGGCESTNDPDDKVIDPVDTTGQQNNDTIKQDTTITLTPYDTADVATYELTIHNDWSAETHPMDFPSDAHFSFLGGATHNSEVSFWKPGGIVSPGMQEMAETGNVTILADEEVEKAIQEGTAYSKVFEKIYTPEKPAIAPGVRTTTLEVHKSHPLVTLVTMLGASPDWFVGVSGLPLFEGGKWKENVEVNLPLYDGGTREGWIPVMGGPEIIPPNPISLITYTPGQGYGPATEPHIVGRMVFKRVQ
ncbi:MAG: spondin domain-containing protein [Candidatus Kapaibacterium sp.]